jgi:hypothetical protein
MSLIQRLLDKFKKPRPAILIDTPYGPVSEVARRQAAINMREDPVLFIKIESNLIREFGVEMGKKEMRRRYPEAFQEYD